jgi:hypothetical protein
MAKMRSLRPSRDEREPYISAINAALADGRIDEAEQTRRIEEAEEASSFDGLDELVADVPFEWQADSDEREKKLGRRRFITGAAGFLLVGGAAYGIVRGATSAARGAVSGKSTTDPAGPAAGGETAEASVPTDLVEVELWQAGTMRTAIDFAESEGLAKFTNVDGRGDDLSVSGQTQDGTAKTISFSRNHRPEVVEDDEGGSESVGPEQLRDLDIKKLRDEVKAKLAKDEARHELNIGYDIKASDFTVEIRDLDRSFRWKLDGLKRVKD